MWEYNYSGDCPNNSNVDQSDELMHYGVKGMRWGIRRKPGPDGTVGGSRKKIDNGYDASLEGVKKSLAKLAGKSANDVSENDRGIFAWDSEGTDEEHWKEPLSSSNPKDVKRIAAELKEFHDRSCDPNNHNYGDDPPDEDGFADARRYRDTYVKDPEAYAKLVIDDINYWRAQRKEFDLLEQSDSYSDELYHYGVKGMRWGVRRASRLLSKSSTSDAKRAKAIASLQKHQTKGSAKVAKLQKQRPKLDDKLRKATTKDAAKAAKLDKKAAKLDKKIAKKERKASSMFTSTEKSADLVNEANVLKLKSNKLHAKANTLKANYEKAKNKVEVNEAMTKAFQTELNKIDDLLIKEGRRYLNG